MKRVDDSGKIFKAALNGDISQIEAARCEEIENGNEEYFLRKTNVEEHNILHIAILYQQNEFIKEIIGGSLLPRSVTDKLIYQGDKDDDTPLHVAAEEGNIEFLKLLIDYEVRKQEVKVLKPAASVSSSSGSSSSMQNKAGNTPLHVALIKRNIDVAELLVKHYPEMAVVSNKEGNTPLHVAAELGNTSIFHQLLAEYENWQRMSSLKNNEGNTALHVAIINGRSEISTLLLEHDHDIASVTNCSNQTPLHLAIIRNQIIGKKYTEGMMNSEPSHTFIKSSDLENAVKNGDLNFLKNAREKEIENGKYFVGQTVSNKDNILHIAVQSQQYELIKEVTERGLLPRSIINKLMNQRNNEGNTPLHVAATVGNIPIFKLLFEYEHGQFEMKNANCCTPFHIAIINHNLKVVGWLAYNHPHLLEKQDHGINTSTTLIELLLEKDNTVTCLCDNEGYTPLHRAAFLTTSLGMRVIRIMLECCPESAKEVDVKYGKTILHWMIDRIPTFKKGKELLQIKGIKDLLDVQDKQGNTPLDLAWKLNFKMVRVLLDVSLQSKGQTDKGSSTSHLQQPSDFDHQPKAEADKDGMTTHLQQLSTFDKMMYEKKKRTVEEYGVVDGVKIQFLREKLSKFGMNFLSSRDSKGRNVLHNLMQLERGSPIMYDEYLDFVKHVIDSYPTLVCQLDFNRDTPLHILLKNSHDIKIHPYNTTQQSPNDQTYNTLHTSALPFELLNICCKYFHVAKDDAEVDGGDYHCFKYDPPWLVQNVEGNTPLHEALKVNHILPLFSKDILGDIKSIASLINKSKETPLHLLAGDSLMDWFEIIAGLTMEKLDAATWQDKDGLTPILRAVQVGHIKTVQVLDYLNNEGSKKVDNNGQTLWHTLVNQPSTLTKELFKDFATKQDVINLLKVGDKKGKTPLHLALESRHFAHARLFLQCSPHNNVWLSPEQLKFIMELLEIKDGDGVTPGDLLASIPDLPRHLEKLLSKYPDHLKGYRSVYGISTKEMNDYVNTMGVIAALLATISFTAAFTVPGGAVEYDKDLKNKKIIGSPLLVDVVAFQAFMFFDISTMCLSTMVLFCLLWILATDTKRKSVMLMDFSILLLLISFYTTLLTFMAGLYVTTIHVKPWIAIYTLAICITLLVLMRKYIAINLLGPIGPTLSTLGPKITRCIPRNQENKKEEEQG